MLEFRDNKIYDESGCQVGQGIGKVYEDHICETDSDLDVRKKGINWLDFACDICEFLLDILD